MFFEDECGRKIMCIHAPERHLLERAHLYFVVEDGGVLKITEEISL